MTGISNSWTAATSVAVALLLGDAQAALIDRGGGLIYDDVLNITWLQNANLGAGSAYDDGASANDGRMTWGAAMAWVNNLDYAGHTGWRLPQVRPKNGTAFVYGDLASGPSNSYSGLTDLGFNVSGPESELGYNFYVNLGNSGYYDTAGNVHPDWNNVSAGPFLNLQKYFYWFSTEYEYAAANFPTNSTFCAPPASCAWDFVIGYGDQTIYPKDFEMYAWAVHDGDIANPASGPATLSLLALGLIGLAASRRHDQVR